MNTTPKNGLSFVAGYKVVGRGMVTMAKHHLPVFLWVNFFATWFVGGGALMLYLGATTWLPLVCVLTPLVALTWLPLNASRYGFSRLLGVPRAVPWLVAMVIALQELATDSYIDQPQGYYVFLVGFIIINSVATLLDIIDIIRWLRGDRAEHIKTGFFETAP